MQRPKDNLARNIRSVDVLDQFAQKSGVGHGFGLVPDTLCDCIGVELVPV